MPFITAAVIVLLPGGADQVESPLTKQLGETPPPLTLQLLQGHWRPGKE